MRRTTLGSAAVVLALAMMPVVSIAAIWPRANQTRSNGETLKFDVVFSPFNYLDLPPAGPSMGDETLFNDQLFSKGKQVGSDGGVCVIVDTSQFVVHCVGTTEVAAGQITFQGLATSAPEKHLAITGGTGKYQGAGGEVILVEFGNGKGSLTFDLLKNQGEP